jgi:hypothetical protein
LLYNLLAIDLTFTALLAATYVRTPAALAAINLRTASHRTTARYALRFVGFANDLARLANHFLGTTARLANMLLDPTTFHLLDVTTISTK